MAGPAFEVISQHRSFGGVVGFYRHDAATTACSMRFAVFTPPQALQGRVPVLYYLAGLTCTEETFMMKAGAQRIAAELGLMLVAPDTSPRGVKIPGDTDSWDFGGRGRLLCGCDPETLVVPLPHVFLRHLRAAGAHRRRFRN
jgi:S-formylglutathione hydrolase